MARWLDKDNWVCEKHFKVNPIHRSIGICPESGCNQIRPRLNVFDPLYDEMIASVIKDKKTSLKLCAYELCTRRNGKRALARPRSIYCHDNCRKAKARKTYKDRKQKESKQQ